MSDSFFAAEGSLSGSCRLCPRRCGADRNRNTGFCGAGAEMEVARIMLHHWEEPPISGPDPTDEGLGSGAVFFSHCSLGCVYCQNRKISRSDAKGTAYSPEELARELMRLEAEGAYNINFVSPTHYADRIAETVKIARRNSLTIPVVWNTGGYERPEAIDALNGIADIFLTDFKYASPELAKTYSGAEDYPGTAASSLARMVSLAGPPVFSEDGMMKKGVIVRHLCLPGCREDSVRVLRKIAETVPVKDLRLSLMAQYTPDFLPPADPASPDPWKKIRRKITTYEYATVAEEASRLGFEGWMQERSSATSRFTPDF